MGSCGRRAPLKAFFSEAPALDPTLRREQCRRRQTAREGGFARTEATNRRRKTALKRSRLLRFTNDSSTFGAKLLNFKMKSGVGEMISG